MKRAQYLPEIGMNRREAFTGASVGLPNLYVSLKYILQKNSPSRKVYASLMKLKQERGCILYFKTGQFRRFYLRLLISNRHIIWVTQLNRSRESNFMTNDMYLH